MLKLKEKEIKLSSILLPEHAARKQINKEGIDELAHSMKKLGMLQPIIVRATGKKFEIEAGHRRYLAAKQLAWNTITCKVYPADDNLKKHLPRAHENMIRENLNPVEEAEACHALVYEEGRGIERAALLLCKSIAWVESRLDIVDFQDDLKEALIDDRTSVAVARALSKVSDTEKRRTLLSAASEYGASAAVVKQWVNDSTVAAALTNQETQSAIANHVSIDVGVTQIECFNCQVLQPMAGLRHIWVCSACLGYIIETAKIMQEEVKKAAE